MSPSVLAAEDAQAAESAEYALHAVIAYADRVHAGAVGLDDAVADLLADLMHLADRSEASFEDLVVRAQAAYRRDLGGSGGVVLPPPHPSSR